MLESRPFIIYMVYRNQVHVAGAEWPISLRNSLIGNSITPSGYKRNALLAITGSKLRNLVPSSYSSPFKNLDKTLYDRGKTAPFTDSQPLQRGTGFAQNEDETSSTILSIRYFKSSPYIRDDKHNLRLVITFYRACHNGIRTCYI